MRASHLSESRQKTELSVVQGDITTLRVDAIVNAANSALAGGGGVDGAIHAAAGPTVMEECRKIIGAQGSCPTGTSVVTSAGRLFASWIIHTVGPIWEHHDPIDSSTLLSNCYSSALASGTQVDARSIAFPAISTGIYGFPRELAAPIAVTSVLDWLRTHEGSPSLTDVIFVCFDETNYEILRDTLTRLT
ncbi:MAG: O-acetyl-ADP-ribose deacetylase [Acidimicrobiales bacterium]|nr:O-acetyl-ADP-ribose deacetylase [Acidimicrobiales bacterium]